MQNYKADFPIFLQKMHGFPLVYLDSSNSSQKPYSVIQTIKQYYENEHANVHRGIYALSENATRAYEATRKKVKDFIHAKESHEIIFTRGTTESINLVANSFARLQLKANDEIILSEMEHHSNIVPWQQLIAQYGIQLKIIPITDEGEIDLVCYEQLFSKRTKLVAISHASNVLGTINPLKEIIKIAHDQNVPVLVDGAQAFPHLSVDVQELDCDFYIFSSHKAYGPTGIGVLYGKTNWLDRMPPYQSGGSMIEKVSFNETTFAPLPYKFEAGTPHIAGVIGFHEALKYMENIGMDVIFQHEKMLLQNLSEQLKEHSDIKIIGTAPHKLGVVSFVMQNVHAHDVGTILSHQGIAVRAGHHCAMPLMERFKIPASVRVSFGIYNCKEDIDIFMQALNTVKRLFKS